MNIIFCDSMFSFLINWSFAPLSLTSYGTRLVHKQVGTMEREEAMISHAIAIEISNQLCRRPIDSLRELHEWVMSKLYSEGGQDAEVEQNLLLKKVVGTLASLERAMDIRREFFAYGSAALFVVYLAARGTHAQGLTALTTFAYPIFATVRLECIHASLAFAVLHFRSSLYSWQESKFLHQSVVYRLSCD